MALTLEQSTALKAYIDGIPELAAFPMTGDGYFDLAEKLNGTGRFSGELAAPDFYVWKEHLTWDEIRNNGFVWLEVDGLTVGKARIHEWMFLIGNGEVNPNKQNIRAGIEECWKGNAGRLAVQASIFAHAQKKATHVEKCFAAVSAAPPTPSGLLGTITNTATAVVVAVTPADVEAARNLA